MELLDAIKTAKEYFESIGQGTVSCVLDAETHWIFYGGDPKIVEFGSAGIKIEKQSGAVEDFILPDSVNFILLERAQVIAIEGNIT